MAAGDIILLRTYDPLCYCHHWKGEQQIYPDNIRSFKTKLFRKTKRAQYLIRNYSLGLKLIIESKLPGIKRIEKASFTYTRKMLEKIIIRQNEYKYRFTDRSGEGGQPACIFLTTLSNWPTIWYLIFKREE